MRWGILNNNTGTRVLFFWSLVKFEFRINIHTYIIIGDDDTTNTVITLIYSNKTNPLFDFYKMVR